MSLGEKLVDALIPVTATPFESESKHDLAESIRVILGIKRCGRVFVVFSVAGAILAQIYCHGIHSPSILIRQEENRSVR